MSHSYVLPNLILPNSFYSLGINPDIQNGLKEFTCFLIFTYIRVTKYYCSLPFVGMSLPSLICSQSLLDSSILNMNHPSFL